MENETLVKLLQEGNDLAYERFVEEYDQYFRKIALMNYGYIVRWIPLEDLIEEAFYISLLAIQQYDEQEDASFKTFITLCVRRSWLKMYRKNMRSAVNHQPMLSLDSNVLNEENKLCYYDVVADPKALNDFEEIKSQDQFEDVFEKLDECKIPYIKEIVNLRIKGCTTKEISQRLNIPTRKIDNSLYRFRKILKTKKNN